MGTCVCTRFCLTLLCFASEIWARLSAPSSYKTTSENGSDTTNCSSAMEPWRTLLHKVSECRAWACSLPLLSVMLLQLWPWAYLLKRHYSCLVVKKCLLVASTLVTLFKNNVATSSLTVSSNWTCWPTKCRLHIHFTWFASRLMQGDMLTK